jgi:hypothetical protein
LRRTARFSGLLPPCRSTSSRLRRTSDRAPKVLEQRGIGVEPTSPGSDRETQRQDRAATQRARQTHAAREAGLRRRGGAARPEQERREDQIRRGERNAVAIDAAEPSSRSGCASTWSRLPKPSSAVHMHQSDATIVWRIGAPHALGARSRHAHTLRQLLLRNTTCDCVSTNAIVTMFAVSRPIVRRAIAAASAWRTPRSRTR